MITITLEELEKLKGYLKTRVDEGSSYDLVLMLTSLQNVSSGWELIHNDLDKYSSKFNSITGGLVVSSIGFTTRERHM